MKILLAVDGSPFSKRMLAYLGTHEALLNGSNDYTVFTAQPALPPRAGRRWQGNCGQLLRGRKRESAGPTSNILTCHWH